MSVANALSFMRRVRTDAGVRERVAALPSAGGLEGLRAVAVDCGYPCSVSDLNAAFRLEWTARWLHFATPRAKDADDAACKTLPGDSA